MKRMISPAAFFHLLEHRLQPVLELAAVLGAGYQGAEIQGDDLLAFQGGRDIAVDDALGQSFDDGGLADAGLADEHRVVFGPARQHLDDPPDLLVTADDRVQLALAGDIGEVAGVFFQGLVFFFGIGVGDPLVAAHRGQGLEKAVAGHSLACQHLGHLEGRVGQHGQEQVLLADVFVLHLRGAGKGAVQQVLQCLRGIGAPGSAAGDLGQLLDQLIGLAEDHGGLDAHFLEHGNDDPAGLLQDGLEQVLGLDLLVAVILGQSVGGLDGLLGFQGKLVELHGLFLLIGGGPGPGMAYCIRSFRLKAED